jgi:hypothetical protein
MKKVLLALVLVSFFFGIFLLWQGKPSAKASFGYDGGGKFISLSFDRPVDLEKVAVNGKEMEIYAKKVQGYTLRYNWEPDKDYTIRLVYRRGGGLLRARAPRLEARLEAGARFYRASFGAREVVAAEVELFTLENDLVRVYLSPSVVCRVTILRLPLVFTSEERYGEFIRELEEELERIGIEVKVVKKLEDAEGVVVIANGAWPEGLNPNLSASRAIYIGAPPGDVLVREDGSLSLGSTWEGVVEDASRVESGLNFRRSAYTALEPGEALAYREDGLPGVFWLRNVLVFSNTLDRGWETAKAAVEDVVEVIVSGFGEGEKKKLRLRKDARNITLVMSADLHGEEWALTLVSENLGAVVRGELEGGMAKVQGPEKVYPGEEAEFRVLIPEGHRRLVLKVTGGEGEMEEASTKGLEARRIRARFSEPGPQLVKLLDGEKVVGCALVMVRSIGVEVLEFERGKKGRIHLKITEDGEAYSGPAELRVGGVPLFEGEVKEGVFRYRGEVPEGEAEVLIHGKSYPLTLAEEGFLPGWMRPYHLVLLLLALASATFSALIRERETRWARMNLPPLPRQEPVYVKAGEVLRVFDLYNARMRWEKFPLTLEEVQRGLYLFGISKGRYPDRDSVRRVLDEVMSISVPEVERRVPDNLCVEKAYGYYAPYQWRKDCQSIEHLAMIRIAYERLLGLGMEVKPLTLPSYGRSYPDLLAVSEPQVFRLAFGGAPADKGIIELFVECETGKKPGKEGEKLLRALREKLPALRREPLLRAPKEKEKGGRREDSQDSEERDSEKKKEKEKEEVTPVTRAMLFVLSPGLYQAYQRLMEKKQDPVLVEAEKLTMENRLFFASVEDLSG